MKRSTRESAPPQATTAHARAAHDTLAAMPTNTDWSAADATARGVLAAHGGVARIDAFLAAGLTRHQVAAIFRRGVLNRPRNAWFVDPDLPWQAKKSIRVGGVATCVTAATLWELPVPPGAHELLHIHVGEHDTRLRHNRDKRRIVHSGDDGEVVWHRRALQDPAAWRTSLVDTLLQLAWCVPLPWLVAALDAALHAPVDGSRSPYLSDAEYERFAALLPKRFHSALALVDPSAESPIESIIRIGMVLDGIGPIVPQFWPTPAHRVDFLVLGRLVVEADGEAWHDPEADAARDAMLRTLGYRVLRFRYDEIVFHLDQVLATIRAELIDMGLLS
jgi:very-short-patch-repair endonuclease